MLIATYDEKEVNLQAFRAVSKLRDRHEESEQKSIGKVLLQQVPEVASATKQQFSYSAVQQGGSFKWLTYHVPYILRVLTGAIILRVSK